MESDRKGETLTIGSQEVVEELEYWEAVPGVNRLNLQGGIHVSSVQRQKCLSVFSHQLWPPRESLKKTDVPKLEKLVKSKK